MTSPARPQHRRATTLLFAIYWGVAAVGAALMAERWTPPHGLQLTVFDSTTWQGRRVFETVDAALSDERLGTPPLPFLQRYSAEWRGVIVVPGDGDYGFRTRSDDGSTLEIDGVLVVDNAGEHAVREVTGTSTLAAGEHDITVRYLQAGARYTLSVLWAPSGRPFEPIPKHRLWPSRMSAGARRVQVLAPVGAALAALVAFAIGALVIRRLPGPTPGVAVLMRAVVWLERPRVAVASLVGVALAARLLMFLTTPPILWPDSHVFYETMREIVAGGLTSHDAYRTLVYPYVLTAFLAHDRSAAAGQWFIAAQQGLGLLTCVGLLVVGRRAMPPLVALGGAALLAVHGMQLFYEMSVLTETVFTSTLMATLVLSLRCYERPTLARSAALGLMLALLVLVRPVAQWFVLCVLAAGWLARHDRRTQWRAATVLLVCYAVPLLTWMMVNQREYGYFGVSLGRGMGLYTRVFEIDGLLPPPSADPQLRAVWATARGLRWSPNRVRDELDYAQGLSTAETDDRMYRFALATVKAAPASFAVGTLQQWARQVATPETGIRTCGEGPGQVLCSGRNDTPLPPFPGDPRPAHAALRGFVTTYVFAWAWPFTAVAACAGLGAVVLLRRRWSAPSLLVVLTVVYFTVVPALTQVAQDRFRLPVDGLLLMLALYGLRAVGGWQEAVHASGSVRA